jgi:two-component system cell cycle sensor histidine kinase/response regulator CckA
MSDRKARTNRHGPDGDGGPKPEVTVVLVVDDDPAVLEVAARVLERAGYRVLQAGEGSEALRVARDHQGGIDLVLTDVVMPGMNGLELGERLARERPETRFLYMSAYTEDEALRYGVEVARTNFLGKPFSLEELAQAVRQALSG